MWQQKSFQSEAAGTLFLVPTPIGNLEDMTYRAIRTLKEAAIIAAEDTRQTKKLCNYFEIDTQIISYHEHNKEASGEKILELLKEGKAVALVSDAGTPCISDPGYELVKEAVQRQCTVVPLPGANAAITALIASGLPTQHFYFYGFLQRQKKDKKQELEKLRYIQDTMIFYEAPHRLEDSLLVIREILGDRQVAVCRELTKKFEEFIRGSIGEVIDWANMNEVRGEFCILVEGATDEAPKEEQWWESLSILDHVQYYIDKKQLSSKEAIKFVAKERNMSKRDVYQEYHIAE